MIEQILDKARKVSQQAEVFYLEAESTPVGFENNRLKHLQSRQTRGIALRMVVDGKIGFASTTDLRDPISIVEAAVEAVPFGPQAHFQLPGATSYALVETYDSAVEAVPLERMIELGQTLIDRVRANSPDLVCQAGVSKDTILVRIINSSGGEASYRKSIFSLALEGLLVRDTDMLFVGEAEASCRPVLDPSATIERTLWQLEMAKEKARVTTGEYPVIFTPGGGTMSLTRALSPISSPEMSTSRWSGISVGRHSTVSWCATWSMIPPLFTPGLSPMWRTATCVWMRSVRETRRKPMLTTRRAMGSLCTSEIITVGFAGKPPVTAPSMFRFMRVWYQAAGEIARLKVASSTASAIGSTPLP